MDTQPMPTPTKEGAKYMCKCPHHKTMPVLIILFGLTFLLGAWGALSQSAINVIWPILIILAGVFKMTKGMCKCCDRS